jgi:tetratricopeptide (TPR) repeat protein
MMRFFTGLVVLGTVLLAGPAVGTASAQGQQQQEPPKNLQVLPKDTPRPQVIAAMQGFTQALGVQCSYCHVLEGPNGRNDTAADDKPTKSTARVMMRLTGEINRTLGTEVGKPAAELTRVQCVTCHRGVAIPKQLSEILSRTSADKGLPAAIDQYRDLRKRYYGAQSYDFSENGLLGLVQQTIAANRTDEAVAWLQLNLEYYPQSARSFLLMAQAYQRKNDKDAALQNVQKALAIEPQNAQAKRALDQLKQQ